MAFEFVDIEEAKTADGLRMICVPGIPSPWGEAAKGIFHVKGVPFAAVRHNPFDDGAIAWAGGHRSAPVVFYNDEPPRWDWSAILLLAERIAPSPALLPTSPADRATAFGLSHEICGEMGLGWCRRNAATAAGLDGKPGFPEDIAKYLAGKYGYRDAERDLYKERTIAIAKMLADRLKSQAGAGSKYYIGDALSAVDIYSATFVALFGPLPPEKCEMPDMIREGYEAIDDDTRAAIDPILFEHRDYVYERYLELPVKL